MLIGQAGNITKQSKWHMTRCSQRGLWQNARQAYPRKKNTFQFLFLFLSLFLQTKQNVFARHLT